MYSSHYYNWMIPHCIIYAVSSSFKPKGPLEIVEKNIPEPGTRQVRIKVQACGVCHNDTFTKEGLFPGIQYPRVPGHEIAGAIDELTVGVRF